MEFVRHGEIQSSSLAFFYSSLPLYFTMSDIPSLFGKGLFMLKIKAILKLAVSICFRSFIVPTFHIVSTVEKSVKKIELGR